MGTWDNNNVGGISPLGTTTYGSYSPTTGDYGIASGYTAKPGSNYLSVGKQNVYNDAGTPGGGTGSQGFFGDMTGAQITGAAVNGIASLGNLYNAWESNGIAKDTMQFNQDMMTKNYDMAKDAYDRRRNRSDNISRQLRGESYNSVYDENKSRESTTSSKDN